MFGLIFESTLSIDSVNRLCFIDFVNNRLSISCNFPSFDRNRFNMSIGSPIFPISRSKCIRFECNSSIIYSCQSKIRKSRFETPSTWKLWWQCKLANHRPSTQSLRISSPEAARAINRRGLMAALAAVDYKKQPANGYF